MKKRNLVILLVGLALLAVILLVFQTCSSNKLTTSVLRRPEASPSSMPTIDVAPVAPAPPAPVIKRTAPRAVALSALAAEPSGIYAQVNGSVVNWLNGVLTLNVNGSSQPFNAGFQGYNTTATIGKMADVSYDTGDRHVGWVRFAENFDPFSGSVLPTPSPTPTPTPIPSPSPTPVPTPTPTGNVPVFGYVYADGLRVSGALVEITSNGTVLSSMFSRDDGFFWWDNLTFPVGSLIVTTKTGYTFPNVGVTAIFPSAGYYVVSGTASTTPTPTPAPSPSPIPSPSVSPAPSPSVSPTPTPSPSPLLVCRPNQVVGNPPTCRCLTQLIGQPRRCKP